MKHFRNILFFLITSLIFSYGLDSLFVSSYSVDNKAILVPDYETEGNRFDIDFLDKRKK